MKNIQVIIAIVDVPVVVYSAAKILVKRTKTIKYLKKVFLLFLSFFSAFILLV